MHAKPMFVRLFAMLVICAAALTVTGCIQNQVDAEFKEDESGVWAEELVYDLGAMEKISDAIAKMMGGMPGQDDDEGEAEAEEEDFDSEEAREEAEAAIEEIDGVELLEFEASVEDKKMRIYYKLAFESVDVLNEARRAIQEDSDLQPADPTGGMGGGMEEEDDFVEVVFDKTDDGWRFEFASNAAGDSDEGPGAGAPAQPGMDELMEEIFAAMHFRFTITMPGSEIVETNAHETDGMTVTWEVEGEDLLGDDAEELGDALSNMFAESK